MRKSKLFAATAALSAAAFLGGCSQDGESLLGPQGVEDRVATISDGSQYAKYGSYKLLTEYDDGSIGGGAALDIGIGNDGTRWVIGTDGAAMENAQNYGVHRWDALKRVWVSAVNESPNANGVRVAVKQGQPVVVKADGRIFQRSASATWTELPGAGRAVDVACSDASIFVLGTDNLGTGDHYVYKFNGSGWTRLSTNMKGARLDVQKNGSDDLVLCRADGSVYQHQLYVENYSVAHRVGPTSGPYVVGRDVAYGNNGSNYDYYCVWVAGDYGTTKNALFASSSPSHVSNAAWIKVANASSVKSIAINSYGYPCYTGTDNSISQMYPFPKTVRMSPADLGTWVTMGESEVRCDEYWALMGVNPGSGTGLPIRNITYFDALLYITRLNKAMGLTQTYGNVVKNNITFSGDHAVAMRNITYNAGGSFRLPNASYWTGCYNGTKYSWEAPPYYWGTTPSLSYAVYGMSSVQESANSTNRWRVGTSLGLYEMSGNVAEMCDDGYNGSSGVTARGGAYSSTGANVKGTSSFGVNTASMYTYVGFRLFRLQ